LYPAPGSLSNPEEMLFVITILDYLTIDEINTSFLNKVVICGIASTFIYADGRNLTPFQFLEHDITHGKNYDFVCYRRINNDREELISFYNFCKETIHDRKRLYSIQLMFFLLIHESFCDFFPNPDMPIITIEETEKNILDPGRPILNINRFFEPNDLGLSIPKIHRLGDDGDFDRRKIKEYLISSIEIYFEELTNWNENKQSEVNINDETGGKKSRRQTSRRKKSRRQTSKRKKSKGKKSRRQIK
jgi:hypothetical protein